MKKNFWELLVESYENDMKRLEEVYSLESGEDIEQMPICNDENAVMPYETPKVNWTIDDYIPIEWIKKQIEEWKNWGPEGLSDDEWEYGTCFETLLENWEKENETNQY